MYISDLVAVFYFGVGKLDSVSYILILEPALVGAKTSKIK